MDGLGAFPWRPEARRAGGVALANLDRLATEGALGLTVPIRPGITPGSGPAHLGLFGYDPLQFVVGRAFSRPLASACP